MAEKSTIPPKFPCGYTVWNKYRREDEIVYPPVNCGGDCDHCGWNPKVAAKRLERQYGIRTS